jgi:hypothetical protein
MSWGSARSLYVLAQWCRQQASPQGNVACNAYHAQPVSEFRVIDTSGPGGSLRTAPPVLRTSARYPVILQAVAADAGRVIIALVRIGHHVSVVRIDAATGHVDAVLFRHAAPAFNGRTGRTWRSLRSTAPGSTCSLTRTAMTWPDESTRAGTTACSAATGTDLASPGDQHRDPGRPVRIAAQSCGARRSGCQADAVGRGAAAVDGVTCFASRTHT